MNSRHRNKHSLPIITLPKPPTEGEWWEGGSDSDDEIPEYDGAQLNLGAETPNSVFEEYVGDWMNTTAPRGVVRRRSWRKEREQKSTTRRRDAADRDCGICFEYAVSPSRTLCCGKIFCQEHITAWLQGPSSDGCCPACEQPCSLEINTLSLASPVLLSSTSISRRRAAQPSSARTTTGSQSLAQPQPPHLLTSSGLKPPASADARGRLATRSASRSNSSSSSSASPSSSCPSSVSSSPTFSVATSASPSDVDENFDFSASMRSMRAMLSGSGSLVSAEMFEVLSRLASIVGLTLILYALFA